MFHPILPLESILCQFNTVPNFTHHLFKIHFNIISSIYAKVLQSFYFPSVFRLNMSRHFLHVAVISSSLIVLQKCYFVNFENHTAPHYAIFFHTSATLPLILGPSNSLRNLSSDTLILYTYSNLNWNTK